MNKIVKAMGLSAAVIAATGVTYAQAEDVGTTGSTTTATNVTVTSADVEQATQLAAKTEGELSVAEEALTEAQENVTVADQAVSEAGQNVEDAEKLVDQATPAAISQAESDVTEAGQAVSAASAVASNSEINLTVAGEAVESQVSNVDQAKTQVNAAETMVATAQKGVDLAQATLDGTDTGKIIEEAAQAEKDLATSEEELLIAQGNLSTALQADQDREAKINQAFQELTRAQEETEAAQTALDSANQTVSDLSATKNLADHALTKAQNDYQAINTITLTPEYIANLKAYAAGGYVSDSAKAAEANLKAMNEQLLASHSFKVNANDSTDKLDTSILSQTVRQELTLFAVDLLNQVRRQMGTEEVVANVSAIEFANTIANNYEADNYDMTSSLINPHDIEAIKKAAAAIGLSTITTSYENIHTYGTEYAPRNYMTISELKETIYDAFVNFLFNGQEYFHAMSVAATPGFNTPQKYIGLAISNRSDAFSVHLVGVADRFITDIRTFNTAATIVPVATTQDILTAYQTAQTQATSAQTALSNAQLLAAEAQSELSETKQKLLQAQASLTQAQAVPLQVPTAQKTLETAMANLAFSQERNNQAQTALQNLNEDTKVKQAALASAKEELAAKLLIQSQAKAYLESQLAKLDQLEVKLAEAKQLLVNAKEALEATKADLRSEEIYLNDLKTAPERLKVAQADWKAAQDLLSQKEAELEVALANYQSAKIADEQAQAEKTRLAQLYGTYLALQEAEKKNQENLLVATPSQLNLTGYSYMETTVKPKLSSRKASLPNTGGRSSSTLFMLGITSLLSAAGLKLKRRKRY